MSEKIVSRRALLEGVVIAVATTLPLAASASASTAADPMVALVDRFLPLYRAYQEACRAERVACDEYANVHQFGPVYEFGNGRYQTAVYGGDLSAIERYYDKCLDEAETPAQRNHLRQR